MIYIRKSYDKFSDGTIGWDVVVRHKKIVRIDTVRTVSDAIRFYLWNIGIPAKIAFRKYRKTT